MWTLTLPNKGRGGNCRLMPQWARRCCEEAIGVRTDGVGEYGAPALFMLAANSLMDVGCGVLVVNIPMLAALRLVVAGNRRVQPKQRTTQPCRCTAACPNVTVTYIGQVGVTRFQAHAFSAQPNLPHALPSATLTSRAPPLTTLQHSVGDNWINATAAMLIVIGVLIGAPWSMYMCTATRSQVMSLFTAQHNDSVQPTIEHDACPGSSRCLAAAAVAWCPFPWAANSHQTSTTGTQTMSHQKQLQTNWQSDVNRHAGPLQAGRSYIRNMGLRPSCMQVPSPTTAPAPAFSWLVNYYAILRLFGFMRTSDYLNHLLMHVRASIFNMFMLFGAAALATSSLSLKVLNYTIK